MGRLTRAKCDFRWRQALCCLSKNENMITQSQNLLGAFVVLTRLLLWLRLNRMEVGFQGACVELTFARLVVVQTVRVYKNPTVTLELLALGGGAQFGSAGLGEGPLLLTGPPAEKTEENRSQVRFHQQDYFIKHPFYHLFYMWRT